MGKDILTILQQEIKRIENESNYNKNYGRKFHVSMLQEFDENKNITISILLNVKVKGSSLVLSRKIFPKDNKQDMIYGLPSLEEEMEYLFNSTM